MIASMRMHAEIDRWEVLLVVVHARYQCVYVCKYKKYTVYYMYCWCVEVSSRSQV